MTKTNDEKNERQKIKYHERKAKAKFVKNALTGIIIVLAILFFLYANSIRQTNADTSGTVQEIRTEIKQLRDSTRQQFNGLDKKLLQQDQKLEGIKAAKAERAKVQPTRLVTSQQSISSGGCEQYRPLVSQYPWNVDVALAVMKAESNCRPEATHLNSNGSVDHGLFQLNNINVHDPAQNIAIAYNQKYALFGWRPWVVCTKGIVRCI